MNCCLTLQITLVSLILLTLISGRPSYDRTLDDDDGTEIFSSEEEESEDLEPESSYVLYNSDNDYDSSFDSFEERKYHERSLLRSSQVLNAIPPRTRQALMDLIQKALDEGLKPNQKHYIPATRFGRHRR